MAFKDLVKIDSRALLEIMQAVNRPFPQNTVFSAEENKGIEDARQIILEAVQDAQEGNPKPLNLLCKWADEIAAYRKNQKEKANLVKLLNDFNLSLPKFLLPPKNLLCSTLGLNTPAMEYALTILGAITTIEGWMDGGIPWERVKRCEWCDKFFLKKGRRKYCSDTCRNYAGQKPYSERPDYYKVLRKLESLLNKPGTIRKVAEEYLRKTSPYKEIIEKRNMDLENILKKEGGS